MPQVPLYDQPAVQKQTLRGGELSAPNDVGAFGGEQAKMLQGIGEGATRFSNAMDRIQERRDLDEAFRIETQAAADYDTFEKGLLKTRKMENAKGVTDDVDKWWEENTKKYKEGASPRAQYLADKSISRARQRAVSSMGTYQLGEETKAQTASFVSVQAQAIDTAVKAGDDASLYDARVKIEKATAAFGAVQGWSEAQVKTEQRKWTSNMHVQVLEQLAEDNPARAREYMGKVSGEIESSMIGKLNKNIKVGEDSRFAKDFVLQNAKSSYEDQLTKVGEITDPDRRDRTLREVQVNYGIQKEVTAQRQKAAASEAWHLAARGKNVPGSVADRMDGEEYKQIVEFQRQRAEHVANQGTKAPKTDPLVHARIYDMAATDPENFKNLRMETLTYKLSPQDLEQVATLQRSMKDPKKEKDLVSYNNKVTARLEVLGIATGNGNAQEQRGSFRTQAQTAIEQHIARTGKPPTPKEEDEILDRLTIKEKTTFFGGKRLFEVSPEKRAKFTPEDAQGAKLVADEKLRVAIDADRPKLEEALRLRGIPVTYQNLTNLYLTVNPKK